MAASSRSSSRRLLVASSAAVTLLLGHVVSGVWAEQAGGNAADQRTTFTSRAEAVRIDVLVTEGGRPVLGLQPGDFEVRDNGVLQRVNLLSYDRVPLKVLLAFDVSQSMDGRRLADLRAAARSLLGELRAEDEAGLVTFNALVNRQCEVTTDHARVASALDALSAGGGTALVDGVYAAMLTGRAGTGRALLMVFSDGLDVSSWLAPDTVLRAAGQSNVVAYAVTASGSGRRAFSSRAPYEAATRRVLDSAQFLRDLASATGGAVHDIASTRDLHAAFARILAEFRQRYLINYVPSRVSKRGWHRVEVGIRGRRGTTVRARSGYLAGGPGS